MRYAKLIQGNRDFAKLWAAQLVSLLGDWFNTIVVSALIVTYTKDTGYQGIAVSGFLIARLIPPLLLRPVSGVLADRFDRKRLLILSDLVRALAVLGLLFTTNGPEYLPLIYVFTIIQFLISSIFEPARNAIMPSILYRNEFSYRKHAQQYHLVSDVSYRRHLRRHRGGAFWHPGRLARRRVDLCAIGDPGDDHRHSGSATL